MGLTDESIMPLGKHKGREMANVPDGWLIWFWGENSVAFQFKQGRDLMSIDTRQIMEYIQDSIDEKLLS